MTSHRWATGVARPLRPPGPSWKLGKQRRSATGQLIRWIRWWRRTFKWKWLVKQLINGWGTRGTGTFQVTVCFMNSLMVFLWIFFLENPWWLATFWWYPYHFGDISWWMMNVCVWYMDGRYGYFRILLINEYSLLMMVGAWMVYNG